MAEKRNGMVKYAPVALAVLGIVFAGGLAKNSLDAKVNEKQAMNIAEKVVEGQAYPLIRGVEMETNIKHIMASLKRIEASLDKKKPLGIYR